MTTLNPPIKWHLEPPGKWRYTLTTIDAARIYDVSPRTVLRWAIRDGAPHKRNGKWTPVYFDQEELEAWVTKHDRLSHGCLKRNRKTKGE